MLEYVFAFFFMSRIMNNPGGVRLYDSLDINNPSNRPIIKHDWRIDAVRVSAVLVGILLLAIFLIVIHAFMLPSKVVIVVKIAWFLLTIIYGSFGVVTIGSAALLLLYLYNLAMKSGLFNVMEKQAHIDRMQDRSDQYFGVQGRRADKSLFQGVDNLTYGHHISTRYDASRDVIEPMEEDIEEQVDDLEMLTLEQLADRGLIARSGNSFLLGIGEDL